METVINEFKTTTSIAEKNLECLNKIYEHLIEQLYLDAVGPNKREESERYYDATLYSQKDPNRIYSVELSFDNENCQLTLMFNHEDKGNMLTARLNMSGYNESMLTKIRMVIREWIYDKVLPSH